MEDKIIGEIRILFEQHKDYYEPKGVSSFWNKYIKCESNGDKKKKLIIRWISSRNKPYLRDIVINLQNSDA